MIERAAANNAAWCDFVCRKHGLSPVLDDDAWTCPTRTPDLYPDAVTLRADADVLARIDDGPGASVKDSFAALDLSANGFEVLFDARWIARPGGGEGPTWDVLHLEHVDLCNAAGVVGLTNVTVDDWSCLVAELDDRCPGATLVGYERGDALAAALAAGFEAIGSLRVWLRP